MSYNIDAVDIVYSRCFSITVEEFERIKDGCECPEVSIFDGDARNFDIRDGRMYPRLFSWTGEGSGHTHKDLVAALSAFDGEADLVLTWEGGDSFTGLRLRDHTVTKHKVIMTLGERT